MADRKVEANNSDSSGKMTLGEFLADIRRIKKLSLRAVEEATGNDVSNAYLSQLEKGHIKQPSPNVLYSLADVYAVPYPTLMEKAGYISQVAVETKKPRRGESYIAGEVLTKSEEESLLEYLAFIRSKRA